MVQLFQLMAVEQPGNFIVRTNQNKEDVPRQYHHYLLVTDNEGYLERITLLTECTLKAIQPSRY